MLGVLPDPLAETELRRQLAREAYERGAEEGWRAGYERGTRQMETEWSAAVAPILRRVIDQPGHAEVERRRWEVRGEQRTRETFGQPHPGDYLPRRLEAAS